MLPRPLVTVLTVLIAVAWAANVVVGFVWPERHDPTLNAIFAIVVGAAYTLGKTDPQHARRKLADLTAGADHDDSGDKRAQ